MNLTTSISSNLYCSVLAGLLLLVGGPCVQVHDCLPVTKVVNAVVEWLLCEWQGIQRYKTCDCVGSYYKSTFSWYAKSTPTRHWTHTKEMHFRRRNKILLFIVMFCAPGAHAEVLQVGHCMLHTSRLLWYAGPGYRQRQGGVGYVWETVARIYLTWQISAGTNKVK